MRPERLLLSGFTAYREMTEPVDFTGVDLFAMTGPTGAGKSSLIDAMCFALYGKVPRLAANQVEPVISLGAREAKVDLTFGMGDSTYRVVRVVRRQIGGGATTAEARLDGPDETVSGADQVTKAVERLIGLSFDHFTRCVVLPQGEFAAFLHDRPANRQELLKSLLDLGLYEKVRQAAVARQKTSDGIVTTLEGLIADSGPAGPQDQALAEENLQLLEAFFLEIERYEKHRAELDKLEADMKDRRTRLASDLALLNSVTAPPDVDILAGNKTAALERSQLASESEKALAEKLDAAKIDLDGLRPMAEIQLLVERFDRRIKLAERLATGEAVIDESTSARDQAETAHRQASQNLDDVVAVLRHHRDQHLANALRRELEVGGSCPVCMQPVTTIPAPDGEDNLSALEADVESGRQRVDEQRRLLDQSQSKHAAAATQFQILSEQLRELEGELVGEDEQTVRQTLAEVEKASVTVGQLEQELKTARLEITESTRELVAAETAQDGVRAELELLRDTLAGLDPPTLERKDSAVDWARLVEWAEERRVVSTRAAIGVDEEAAALEAQIAQADETVLKEAERLGLAANPSEIRVVAERASAVAEERLKTLIDNSRRLEEHRQTLAVAKKKSAVAASLARELAANRFEAWILEEALHGLTEGANRVLETLVGGQYELSLVKRDFEVIDRRNADERRPVKTLSGGETFLVSLALALSLAERIATLSIAGTPRLDAIFLDEGFGTLDAGSLDTVAAVLHELSSGDRMVGIVTHVKELAEQMPVRFVVTNGPSGASVRREP